MPAALILLLIALTACAVPASPPTGQSAPHMQPEYDNQTLIIFYDPKIGSEPLLQAVQQYGARVVYRYQNFNGISIVIPPDKEILAAQKHFESVRGVLSVQRNGVYHLD